MSLVVSVSGSIKDYRDHYQSSDIAKSRKTDTTNNIRQKALDYLGQGSPKQSKAASSYSENKEKFEADKRRDFHAKDVMSQPVLTGMPMWTVEEAIHYLKNHRISHLPIQHDGEIKGIVSCKDLMGQGPHTKLQSIMTAEVILAKTSATIREIAMTMMNHSISSLPVISNSDVIIGIVTKSDLAHFLISHVRLDFKG